MNRRTADHLNYVAAAFDVKPDAILGTRRTKNAVEARHVLCWMLRRDGLSYPHIGAIIERDHTTVMYAVRKVDDNPRLVGVALGKRAA